MKLSFETVKSITVGAVDIKLLENGIHFSKCTSKQLDVWGELSPVLRKNAEATTGIRLDFHTNSSSFKFTVSSGKKFEIYINDVLKCNMTGGDLTDGSYSIALSGTENRITLIFPAHDIPCVLSSVEVDDGATVKPHRFDKKLLFIGDSITQGWESGYDSLSYAYRVSRFFNADSVIQGVGGGDFRGLFDPDIDYDPDAVIVALGTNDWSHASSLEEILHNADVFLDALTKKYSGKPIIGISPIWRDVSANPVRPAGTFDGMCEALKQCFAAHGLYVVDGRTLTPHISDFYADKTLHPNALGFGVYAENLIKAIKDIIWRR